MPYVARDENGHIAEVAETPSERAGEHVALDSPELVRFLTGQEVAQQMGRGHGPDQEIQSELAASDLELVRVIEDLIGVLIEKQVIMMTDLPKAAQTKLSKRFSLRSKLQDLGNIVGEPEEVMLP